VKPKESASLTGCGRRREDDEMILESEKEFRQAMQVAVGTALACWGFPLLALLLVLLFVPWRPIYYVAAHLVGVILVIRARRTARRAMRKLNEEPVHAV